MTPAAFLGSRLLKGALTLLAIALLNFALVRAAPGDPAMVLAGESGAGDAVYLAQLRERFGLDRPLPVQLGIYLRGLATLDLGTSYRQNLPVATLIAGRLPATLLLTGTAFAFSLTLGVALGLAAARRAGTLADTGLTVLSLAFYATPLFWVALLGQLGALWLARTTGIDLPTFGYETVGAGYTGLRHAADVAAHLLLPALTLGLFFTAVYARVMRASALEAMGADHVRTARAKGLPPGIVLRRHVARNALLPVVTLAGLQAGQLVGGAVLTETVFAWPGLGRLLFEALAQRDYPVLLGVFFVSSALVVLVNLATDLVSRVLDPRIGAAR